MKSKSCVLASILLVSTAAFALPPVAEGSPDAPRAERGAPHGFHEGKSISRADAMAKAGEHFDRVDSNKDGMIDAAERKAAREKMRAWHKAAKAAKGDAQMPSPASK